MFSILLPKSSQESKPVAKDGNIVSTVFEISQLEHLNLAMAFSEFPSDIPGFIASFAICLLLVSPCWAQTCPTSVTDYKDNGSGKYCIEFNTDPGVASVTYLGVNLPRDGTSNRYTNGFNCNGSATIPGNMVISIGGLTCTYTNGVLPITLHSFEGQMIGSQFELIWETASETNNEYFSIQRSSDGEVFYSIGTVPGAGNSTRSLQYTFVDTDPLSGHNYYRLEQFDFDGRSSFSEIIVYENQQVPKFRVVIRNRILTIYSNEPILGIEVFTAGGLQVSTEDTVVSSQEFDLSSLPTGLYIARVRTIDGLTSEIISVP